MKRKIIIGILLIASLCGFSGTPGTPPAPVVTITSPKNGDLVKDLDRLYIKAVAYDSTATIKVVDFFMGGYRLSSDSLAPYETSLLPFLFSGTVKILAVATNDKGEQYADSVSVTIVENKKPLIELIHPTSQTIIMENELVNIEANASDPDGKIESVEFYIDNRLKATDTSAPYTMTWKAPAGATHIRVIAKDDTQSQAADEVIALVSKPPFAVNISKPLNGSKIIEGEPRIIEAQVQQVNQPVERIDFFVNDQFIGWDSVAPYTINWIPEAGMTMIKAIAISTVNAADSILVNVLDTAQNQPPVVRLLDHYDGMIVYANNSTGFGALASDADGSVKSVEFFINEVSIGTDDTPPFQVTWRTVRGLFEVTAIATDDKGAKSQRSNIFHIYVNDNASVMRIIRPVANRTYKPGKTIDIEAYTNARNSPHYTERNPITFYVDDSLLGTVHNYPYRLPWVATKGKHTIKAVSMDFIDPIADSVSITVDDSLQTLPPILHLLQPPGIYYVPGENVPLQAYATDEDGTITAVSFFVNDSLIHVDNNSPFATSWIGVEGWAMLKAVAQDDKGLKAADSLEVLIRKNTPPFIKIMSPSDGQIITSGPSVFIQTAATDSTGEITQVEFFVNGQSLGVDMDWPYNINWNAVNGDAVIKVLVTDDRGLQSFDSVKVHVNYKQDLTTIKITKPINASVHTVGDLVELEAEVKNASETVDYVEFQINDLIILRDSVPPYRVEWTPQQEGLVTIEAFPMHVNNHGEVTPLAMDVIQVHVKQTEFEIAILPIKTPFSIDIYPNMDLTLEAAAADSKHAITKVEFFAEGNFLGLSTSVPYTAKWRAKKGHNLLIARATNEVGEQVSDTLIVYVKNSMLELEITNPLNGEQFKQGDVVDIAADIFISGVMETPLCHVEFFANGVSVGIDSKLPHWGDYHAKWTAVKGYTLIKAVGWTTSEIAYAVDSVVIKVNDTISNDPPQIEITHPLDSGVYEPNATLSLQANAFDTDGYVKAVNFFVYDSSLTPQFICTDTLAPYSCDWLPLTEGKYKIIASASDNEGAVAYAKQIGITIQDASGIHTIDADQWINVYPNPAKDILVIEAIERATVELIAVDGRSILTETHINARQRHTLNLEGISSGSYILKVHNDKFISFKKVMINH